MMQVTEEWIMDEVVGNDYLEIGFEFLPQDSMLPLHFLERCHATANPKSAAV
jgi:hypothetical protein